MQFVSNGLQHTISTVMVFQSTEYARFKMINGNRQLNEKKIKKIIKEIEMGNDLLYCYPIQVHENNGRLEIMDGQHRFYISSKLKRPVYYILLKKEVALPQIAKVNSNVEKWKGADFINCFVQLGNTHYMKLQEIMDQYPVPITTLIAMLQQGKINNGSSTMDSFYQGEFEINHYEFTIQILVICSQFDYASKFSRNFINAISRMITAENVKMGDVIEKVNKNKAELIVSGEWKDYLTNIENIFNKGNRIRVTTY